MTVNEINNLSDEELYSLSLQKDKKGRYTDDANTAYAERQRRAGFVYYADVPKNCSKYQNDFDYYGWVDE